MNPNHTPWKTLSDQLCLGTATDGWNLASTCGTAEDEERTFYYHVLFSSPFTSSPVVQLGLTGFDMDQRQSPRIQLQALEITPNGFTACLSTWRDTQIYSVTFNWLAIGS